jgi:predicted RNA-binding protein YlqC (UPF0109 family)
MAISIDQQFVEYVVKSLVNNPDAVHIDRRIDEKGVLLELTVDAEDLGRVIGKRGATAQSLRTLLRALGTKNEARYNLKIVDVDRPEGMTRPEREDDNSSLASAVGNGVVGDNAATNDTDSTDSVTVPLNDDLDDDDTNPSTKNVRESDTMAKTRRELADLDDLDI